MACVVSSLCGTIAKSNVEPSRTRRVAPQCSLQRCEEGVNATGGRRQALFAAVSLASTCACAPPAQAEVTAKLLFREQPESAAALMAPLDGTFANMVTGAVYEEMNSSGIMTENQFQLEFNKLFRQEYPYYQKANKDKMPAIPDLSDLSGGLSNKTYFNFTLYCQWKILARHLPTEASREEFVKKVGVRVVEAVAPEALTQARNSRESFKAAAAAGEPLPTAILTPLLDALVAKGYITAYESQRAGSSGQLGGVPSYEAYGADQLLEALNEAGGGGAVAPGKFTLILRGPADLQGGVALRAEENGFWQRIAPAAVEAVFDAAGLGVTCDETFFQNEWQSPTGLKQKLLLFIGDPFFQVDVPFTPDTLLLEVAPRQPLV